MTTQTLSQFVVEQPTRADMPRRTFVVPVYRTERVLSPAALAHLRQLEAAGVALDRSQFADEWPGMSDEEYDELYSS